MKNFWRWPLLGFVFVALAASAIWVIRAIPTNWTADEIKLLQSLSLRKLAPLGKDPSNQYAENGQAAKLGQQLFFDVRFSKDGTVACATCHLPAQGFQDSRALGLGVGIGTRRTMPIANTAYSPWLFWDGRKDSQWSQALGPLENPVEHGSVRTHYVQLIEKYYKSDYETVFGKLPDFSDAKRFQPIAGPVEDVAANAAWRGMLAEDQALVTQVFVNMGKAIAAYERRIVMMPSRFDDYVDGLGLPNTDKTKNGLSDEEISGLRLFIGKANCVQCHNGPLLTNNEFHNTGVPMPANNQEDEGRAKGIAAVKTDEFNCLSKYSDAALADCAELRFIQSDTHLLERAFKVPSLRNVASRAPYMHAGQIQTLAEVIQHYSHAPIAPKGHSEIKALHLSTKEKEHLIAFLKSLDAPIRAPE